MKSPERLTRLVSGLSNFSRLEMAVTVDPSSESADSFSTKSCLKSARRLMLRVSDSKPSDEQQSK